MRPSTGFILLLIIALLIVAFYTQHLWLSKAKVDQKLADTTATLKTARQGITALNGVVDGLATDTSRKGRTIDRQGKQIATLSLNAAQAQSRALQSVVDLGKSGGQISQRIITLDAVSRKAAADEVVGGVGAVATSVHDTLLNRQIGTLKGIVKNDGVVISGVVEANAQLSQQLADEKAKGLDLVDEVNGVKRVVIQQQQQTIAVQKFVLEKQAEARGPFAKKRRNVLGEVNTKLAEGQK